MELLGRAGCRVTDGHTLRELVWIAEARDKTQWEHTAAIRATIHNSLCGRGQGRQAKDFNPYRQD